VDLLRHVQYFVTIAEEHQFGHAARRLGISQPPLSRGLQRLESELGLRLFERGPRGVSLTDAGAALLPHARRLLRTESALREAAETYAPARTGVRVGVVPQLPARQAANLAGECAALTGESGVSLFTASTTALVEGVSVGRLDVAVVVHPAVVGELIAGPVALFPTTLLVPERLARRAAAGLRQLVTVPLAVPPRDHNPAAHDLVVDTLAEHGVTTEVVTVADERAALGLVATEQACALTADPDLHADGVTRHPLPADLLPLRLRVIAAPTLATHLPPELPAALAESLR
jgi:DNA-binding transcriptional LysR family regulator